MIGMMDSDDNDSSGSVNDIDDESLMFVNHPSSLKLYHVIIALY